MQIEPRKCFSFLVCRTVATAVLCERDDSTAVEGLNFRFIVRPSAEQNVSRFIRGNGPLEINGLWIAPFVPFLELSLPIKKAVAVITRQPLRLHSTGNESLANSSGFDDELPKRDRSTREEQTKMAQEWPRLLTKRCQSCSFDLRLLGGTQQPPSTVLGPQLSTKSIR